MMIEQTEVVVTCDDQCGHDTMFLFHDLPTERELHAAMEKEGWQLERGKFVCPDCVALAEEEAQEEEDRLRQKAECEEDEP